MLPNNVNAFKVQVLKYECEKWKTQTYGSYNFHDSDWFAPFLENAMIVFMVRISIIIEFYNSSVVSRGGLLFF